MATISSIIGGLENSLNSHYGYAPSPSSGPRSDASMRQTHEPAGPAQLPGQAPPKPTPEHINFLVAEVQRALDTASTELLTVKFRSSSDRASYVLELRNSDGELVWQVPAEKALNLRDKLDELSGMAIDEVT